MSQRLTPLNPDTLSLRQREIYDDIVSRRGRLGGPFPVWLRSPELAETAQKLGAYCRYDTSLAPILSELAILVVARHWRASVEWAIHAPIASKAGLTDAAIEAIRIGQRPNLPDAKTSIIYVYSKRLLEAGHVEDDLHDQAVAELGETGVVDLVALIGYYGLVALTLNAFKVPLPDDRPAAFGA